ncbi:hypothetical protein MKP05_09520 [Halomonas sp. EGI 63088]|uniref:Phage regulatory protein CII (CP76) n=1 Tax=Halomonas flagellata TaxID=2920385 RepID=A0ABS9RU23_9GAMM|nr:phage regulatory CII family protein [Halomonas flagellata]MCH4563368.1 hypothetical protein [Halomonas flagellata]
MSKRWMSSVDRAQREVLPLHLALYHAARAYPGGVKAIAAVYGFNPTTLQHKLSPTEERHRANIDDLEAVLATTRDTRILDSLGEIAGGCLWVMPVERRRAPRGDDQHDVLETLATLHDHLGEMITSIRTSLRDGVVDDRERAELRLRSRRLLEAVLLLEQAATEAGEVSHG